MQLPFDLDDFHLGLSSQRALLAEMDRLYHDLDAKLADVNDPARCRACGNCCDFESFGHKLYLTTPELLYFAYHVGRPFKPMTSGVCPWRVKGRCSVYPYRFAGCRIFQCKGNASLQSDLTETTLTELKQLCQKYSVPYLYIDLKTAIGTAAVSPKSCHKIPKNEQ